jgi:hypothetical protein
MPKQVKVDKQPKSNKNSSRNHAGIERIVKESCKAKNLSGRYFIEKIDN